MRNSYTSSKKGGNRRAATYIVIFLNLLKKKRSSFTEFSSDLRGTPGAWPGALARRNCINADFNNGTLRVCELRTDLTRQPNRRQITQSNLVVLSVLINKNNYSRIHKSSDEFVIKSR